MSMFCLNSTARVITELANQRLVPNKSLTHKRLIKINKPGVSKIKLIYYCANPLHTHSNTFDFTMFCWLCDEVKEVYLYADAWEYKWWSLNWILTVKAWSLNNQSRLRYWPDVKSIIIFHNVQGNSRLAINLPKPSELLSLSSA